MKELQNNDFYAILFCYETLSLEIKVDNQASEPKPSLTDWAILALIALPICAVLWICCGGGPWLILDCPNGEDRHGECLPAD